MCPIAHVLHCSMCPITPVPTQNLLQVIAMCPIAHVPNYPCVMVEQAEVVLHSSFLWSLCQLVWWRGFRTMQGTVLNRA